MILATKLATVGLAGALFASAGDARAEGTQGDADALFAEGRVLLEKGRYAEACAKLKRSEELAQAVGTLLNLGYCWEQLGRFRSAMESYAEAEVLAGKTGDAKRSAFAKERLAAVQPRVQKAVILVTPPVAPDLEIRRNGVVVPKTDWGMPIPIDPDEIEISARAPGRQPWRGVVMGRGEGSSITVFVPPLAEQDGRGRERGRALGAKRITALALGGAALVGIGAGVATGLAAKARYDDSRPHCDGTGCDPEGVQMQRSAASQGNLATALVGFALLSAGAGVYLWIAGDEKSKTVASARGWRLGLSGGGAAVGARF